LESDWRSNVQAYGWAYGPVGLFATLLDVFPGLVLSDWFQSGDPTIFAPPTGPGQLAVPLFTTTVIDPTANFPYGFKVSPD